MAKRLVSPRSTASDQKADTDQWTTDYNILGYRITVTIHRRQKLNKFGRFLALNHDETKVEAYLEQCVKTDKLEPREVVLENSVRFSLDAVEKERSA